MDRRRFLLTTGGATLGMLSCKTLERGYPEEYFPEQPAVPGVYAALPGKEKRVRTHCLQCEGSCGIVVRVVEGRAVGITGNRDYPTNQGGLCPKGLNGLQVLYDPDRIQGPLRRTGRRGEGGWERVSWDEALASLAGDLSRLRTSGQAHRVAVVGGRYPGHMRDLVRRFLTAYGSPNEIDHEALCSDADELAFDLCMGTRQRPAFDWEETDYVLSFGAGLIESFRPTAMMLRIFGHLRNGRPGRRARIVQVDTRLGVTAARADEWVSIRPATDAALALGMAHVLLRDGLHNRDFVRDHTFGFSKWTDPAGREHLGFEDLVRRDYAPARAAELTGVPEATIERLAREFAVNQPGIAVAGRGVAAHTNGVYNVLAVNALNALVGNLGARGGVIAQEEPPFADWPQPPLDHVAREGLRQPRFDLDGEVAPFARSQLAGLAERLERGQPYPLAAVLVYYTNPLFSAPEPERLRAALDRVPLLVSFSPFMDESTAQCDLVLPDHTYLERWQLNQPPPSVGFPVFGVRQPVVAPRHDTRSTGEVLVQLAKALGGSVAQAFPTDELELIKERVRGVQASGRGSIRADTFEAFWDALLAAGGWWDPAAGRGAPVVRTASGRYEFYATRLAWKLGSAATDVACLPHFEPVHALAAAAELPFALASYKTMTHAEGRGANQPHLQEVFGVQFDRSWHPWVELNPDDAAELGVADGDHVWLETARGRIRLPAVLAEGTQRGTVNVPFEHGHTAYGRWAAGRGVSVNPLVTAAREPLGGGVAWYDVHVAVSRA